MTETPSDDMPVTDPEVRDATDEAAANTDDGAADAAGSQFGGDETETVELDADAAETSGSSVPDAILNTAEVNTDGDTEADTDGGVESGGGTKSADAAGEDAVSDVAESDTDEVAEIEADEECSGESEAAVDGGDLEPENTKAVPEHDGNDNDDDIDENDSDDGGNDSDSDDEDAEDSEDDSGYDDSDDEAPDANGVTPLAVASVVEAILFAAREPLKIAQIARAVGKRTRQEAVREAIDELNVHYLETARAFEIAEISGRYQLMSRPEYAEHIMRIYPKRELTDKDKSHRLTPAALDTLAIIAYKQPVMRSEIEHIRGVACGPVLKALIERGSVREVGRRADLVGKPAVFGTTERFLAEFGLGSLEELPLRNEFQTFPGMEPPVEMTLVQPESADDNQATETEVEPVSSAEALNPAGTGREPAAQPEDDASAKPAGDAAAPEDAAATGEDGDVDILASLPNRDEAEAAADEAEAEVDAATEVDAASEEPAGE